MPEGIEFRKYDEFPREVLLFVYKHKALVGRAIGYKKTDGTICIYPKRLTVPGVFPKTCKVPIRVRYDAVPWVKYIE